MTTVLPNGELQSNPKIAYNKGYEHGRADEQLRSIESAKEQAKEYRVALEEAKADGAREFAEWLKDRHVMNFCNIEPKHCEVHQEAYCKFIDDVLAEYEKERNLWPEKK